MQCLISSVDCMLPPSRCSFCSCFFSYPVSPTKAEKIPGTELMFWCFHSGGNFVQVFNIGQIAFNPIQDGLFRDCSTMRRGAAKRPPLPKICHTYHTMMKLGSYTLPKEDRKIYESRDTLLEFCWHQYFFTGNQQILLYQEIQI